MSTAPTSAARPSGLSLDQIDESIRIQDDLFGHVNGRWLAGHEMPADRSSDGAFHALRDLSEERVREIVEEAAADVEARDPRGGQVPTTDHDRVGTLYRMFMDTAARGARGRGGGGPPGGPHTPPPGRGPAGPPPVGRVLPPPGGARPRGGGGPPRPVRHHHLRRGPGRRGPHHGRT